MTRTTRKLKSNETDKRFVNSLINSLRVEAHVSGYQFCGPGTKLKKRLDRGDKGINPLDVACRDHDIVYERKKLVAYAVTNVMKAMGCKGKRKRVTKNNSMLAAKKKRTSKKKNNGKSLISTPGQSGGVVPLIPIFAGLSALGSLMSGGAKIVDNENNNAPMMCYIKLEEGCYEIEDINQRDKKQIDVYNSENLTKLTFDISVDPNDFRSYIKLYTILRSEKAANLNTINSIKVMCNIAQGSFNNHLQSHSIYEFYPSGRTGSKLVDLDHNPIDNFGEALTIVLHIKRYGF
ncbi:hypothetical protein AGLY_002151 [Aphis glycines]|uniref:Phospholipase A2-like domain-containing protein n=1 Tax=Aphis glycines TaxID=307491 RepID=A0A6G0U3R9_APHGL|nr:hypothetical protein AGLY_002151 [Aphis glycines]